MSIDQRIQKIEPLNDFIITTFLRVKMNHQLLVPLTKGVVSNAQKRDAIYILRYSIFMYIISEMNSIMFDEDKRAASIHNIIKAFKCKDIEDYYRNQWSKTANYTLEGEVSQEVKSTYSEKAANEEKEKNEKFFNNTYFKVIDLFKVLKESELYKRLSKARDKMISHKEVLNEQSGIKKLYDPEELGLKFSDAEELIKQSEEIIQSVSLILERKSVAFEAFQQNYKLLSDELWKESLTI